MLNQSINRPVICNFWHPGTLTLSHERQSARMSKITNDGITRSATGCFIAVQYMATMGVKGLSCMVNKTLTPPMSSNCSAVRLLLTILSTSSIRMSLFRFSRSRQIANCACANSTNREISSRAFSSNSRTISCRRHRSIIAYRRIYHWAMPLPHLLIELRTISHVTKMQHKRIKLPQWKITKIVATRCQILRLKCTQFDFGWGSAPDPAGGA